GESDADVERQSRGQIGVAALLGPSLACCLIKICKIYATIGLFFSWSARRGGEQRRAEHPFCLRQPGQADLQKCPWQRGGCHLQLQPGGQTHPYYRYPGPQLPIRL